MKRRTHDGVSGPPGGSHTEHGEGSQGRLGLILSHPDFRILWLSTLGGQFGMGMQQVVLGWVVLAMTDASSMVGLLFAVRSTPNLVIGFAAGAMTDRLDRRTLMRLVACGMAVLSCGMAWLVSVDRLSVWLLLVCAGLLGTLHAFDTTARQTYVVDAVGVRGAVAGLSLMSLGQRLGGVFGSLTAGVTLEAWGTGMTFLVMGLSYALGGGTLYALRHRGAAAPVGRESLRQNVRTYVQALRTNQAMQSLMLSTAVAEVLGFSHQVLLPILAREVLHVGAAGLGLLTAFRSVGGVLGAVMLSIVGQMRRRGVLLLVMLALFGAGLLCLASAPSFWLAVVCVTGVNIAASATDILHQSLLQHSVSNEQRGRAMGSWLVGTGTAPLGHLEIGYLAGMTTAPVALCIHGMVLIILTIILAVRVPRLRQL